MTRQEIDTFIFPAKDCGEAYDRLARIHDQLLFLALKHVKDPMTRIVFQQVLELVRTHVNLQAYVFNERVKYFDGKLIPKTPFVRLYLDKCCIWTDHLGNWCYKWDDGIIAADQLVKCLNPLLDQYLETIK